VAVAGALGLITGAVFAFISIANARVDVLALREGSRSLTSSRRRHAVRGALVAGQVALALVLLAAAGLMVKSFRNLRGVQPGFDPRGVVTMGISLPAARYNDDRTSAAFVQQLAGILTRQP